MELWYVWIEIVLFSVMFPWKVSATPEKSDINIKRSSLQQYEYDRINVFLAVLNRSRKNIYNYNFINFHRQPQQVQISSRWLQGQQNLKHKLNFACTLQMWPFFVVLPRCTCLKSLILNIHVLCNIVKFSQSHNWLYNRQCIVLSVPSSVIQSAKHQTA